MLIEDVAANSSSASDFAAKVVQASGNILAPSSQMFLEYQSEIAVSPDCAEQQPHSDGKYNSHKHIA